MVNFHFDGKQALLLAVLGQLAQEYRDAVAAVVEAADGDPVRCLEGLVRRHFDADLAEPRKVAVWYAFWGETQARDDYLDICDASDRAQLALIEAQIEALAARGGLELDAQALALGLNGLMEGLWQSILRRGKPFSADEAVGLCRRYLANLFPEFAGPPAAAPAAAAGLDADRRTLPAFAYVSDDFHRAEMDRIHLPAWHFICHVSEVSEPGRYVAADLIGRRVFVLRGDDGAVRAFHNVCPHRAHAVVAGREGHCQGAIRCPYHAWTFAFDGALKTPAYPDTFRDLEAEKFGLKPVEMEVFMGLVFVRFRAGGAALAERMAAHAGHLGAYRIADMQPRRRPWSDIVKADWKNVMDNYLECYHCPLGHPGLSCLMQPDYANLPDDASRTALFYHDMREEPPHGWSPTLYNRLLPDVETLPDTLKRRWSYLFAYPGITFNLYPDALSMMVVRPLGPGRTWVGGRTYALPDARREMRAARYLNGRINAQVQREDVELVTSVQRGLGSGVYHTGVFSDREAGVAAFHRWVREDMPQARL
jgi:phenylpropionate dioxygenase-like ring-hydroxylating dioxygenase large terminal subunit